MKLLNLPLLLLLTACVSVQLQKPLILEKSKNYSLVSPTSPFQRIEQAGMDQYWRNNQSGNAISLQTACSENYDPSLQDLITGNIQGIEDAKLTKENKISYNERAALSAEYEGLVDGIAVMIHLISFKKNNCSYVLSYFGKSSQISSDKYIFDNFIKNFRVK